MFDLKEKIFDHAARQIDAPVAHQAANNKVTVPAVHFIETAARNYIFIFEVQEARRIQTVGVDFAGVMNDRGQMFDFKFALISAMR